MKKPSPGILPLFISLIMLIYPAAFWITWITFWNNHPNYPPALKSKEYELTYPIFGFNQIASISAILLLIGIVFSTVALFKLPKYMSYFIALPILVISSLLFLLTLFSLM